MRNSENFRARAVEDVDGASFDQVRQWAIEWRAAKLADEARREALAVERKSTNGVRREPIHTPDSKRLHRILCEVGGAYGVETKSAEKMKLFADMSDSDKILVYRNKPWHGGIDESDPCWLNFIKTEDGARAARVRKARRKREFERKERNDRLVAAFRKEEELRLTQEFLETEFSFLDGRRVTWGQATEADHRERIEILDVNIHANLEAAARHEAALDLLAESGASRLSEVTQ